MKVKKGQLLRIRHARKGTFVAVALTDFDTDEVEYWPVAVAEGYVERAASDWSPGESIPCRAALVAAVELVAPAEVEAEVEVSGKGL